MQGKTENFTKLNFWQNKFTEKHNVSETQEQKDFRADVEFNNYIKESKVIIIKMSFNKNNNINILFKLIISKNKFPPKF